jgi:hypothetical protein
MSKRELAPLRIALVHFVPRSNGEIGATSRDPAESRPQSLWRIGTPYAVTGDLSGRGQNAPSTMLEIETSANLEMKETLPAFRRIGWLQSYCYVGIAVLVWSKIYTLARSTASASRATRTTATSL